MRVFKSKLLHVATALFLGFIPLALFVGPVNLFVFVGSVSFTMSLVVVHAYWPALKLAVRSSIEELDFVDLLTAGIALIFISTCLREAYATFYREFFVVAPVVRPDDYYLPLAFSRFVAVAAGYMALAAYQSNPRTAGVVGIPGWPRAVLALVVGCLVGTGLMVLHV